MKIKVGFCQATRPPFFFHVGLLSTSQKVSNVDSPTRTISHFWIEVSIQPWHYVCTQLLDCIPWDHVPREHKFLIISGYSVDAQHPCFKLWTFRQITVSYHSFLITSSFFGMTSSCKLLNNIMPTVRLPLYPITFLTNHPVGGSLEEGGGG